MEEHLGMEEHLARPDKATEDIPDFESQNFYERLGVSQDATAEEIHNAFKRLSKKFHGDLEGGSEEAFKYLSEADRELTDPALRARYDAKMGSARDTHPVEKRHITKEAAVKHIGAYFRMAYIGHTPEELIDDYIKSGVLTKEDVSEIREVRDYAWSRIMDAVRDANPLAYRPFSKAVTYTQARAKIDRYIDKGYITRKELDERASESMDFGLSRMSAETKKVLGFE